ncbi:unnamed protein product [Rangifer tarandus platyrhynchus]|uniref:Uncharacterized protein n=1 Tax=Rangifer tarandus platyrhynchus TaxID=3082113 RepID=A0AC60A875_RANTA
MHFGQDRDPWGPDTTQESELPENRPLWGLIAGTPWPITLLTDVQRSRPGWTGLTSSVAAGAPGTERGQQVRLAPAVLCLLYRLAHLLCLFVSTASGHVSEWLLHQPGAPRPPVCYKYLLGTSCGPHTSPGAKPCAGEQN